MVAVVIVTKFRLVTKCCFNYLCIFDGVIKCSQLVGFCEYIRLETCITKASDPLVLNINRRHIVLANWTMIFTFCRRRAQSNNKGLYSFMVALYYSTK